jgi:hypothetical protein
MSSFSDYLENEQKLMTVIIQNFDPTICPEYFLPCHLIEKPHYNCLLDELKQKFEEKKLNV